MQSGSAYARSMRRRDSYQAALRALNRPEWPRFLREHSGLPGPRANLELAQAVADVGDGDVFDTLIATDEEYLVLCGVLGLGRLLADDVSTDLAARLRANAPDSRWRVREGVAMALQRVGDSDVAQWRELANSWACDPDPLVQRAAVAGAPVGRSIRTGGSAVSAGDLFVGGPARQRTQSRRCRALRQALGYCWSVAIAADPPGGLPGFGALQRHDDPDVRWIVRENTKKSRLARLL